MPQSTSMKRHDVQSQKETEATEDRDSAMLTISPQDIFPDGGLRAWLVVCGVCDLIPSLSYPILSYES